MTIRHPDIHTPPAHAASAIQPGYMSGFGNGFETEALPGALPLGRNSPQRCAYGLYAEQLSGSPFTAPRTTNERSWLYRIRPSVRHTRRFSNSSYPHWKSAPCLDDHSLPLGQLRWNPLPAPKETQNFLEGLRTMTTAGDVLTQVGMAAHAYTFNADMVDDYFFNADGELLVVPQLGAMGPVALAAANIEARPLWKPMHLQPVYEHARSFVDGTSERLFTTGLSLPSGSVLGEQQLARVVGNVTRFLGKGNDAE